MSNCTRRFQKYLILSICPVFLLSSCLSGGHYHSYTDHGIKYYVTDDQIDAEEELAELQEEGGEVVDVRDESETEIAAEEIIESEGRSKEEIIADIRSKETFPLVYNPMVEKWIQYFQGKGRKNFVKWLGRSTRYLDIMQASIKKYNLPNELVYLSMIESGFNNRAYSRAKAVGMWQFMRSTGRAYGLQIDWWIDERKDPYKSADAAARHLKDLYEEFDNWYLAAAAYNAGPAKIKKAIHRYGTTNFWELTRKRKRYLKPETKNYVPKIIAATLIAKNLKKYGFSKSEIQYQKPLKYDEFKVSVPIDLYQVSKLTGTSIQSIKDLNPELRRNIVPPNSKNYSLKIPKGKRKLFATRFEKIKHTFKNTKYLAHNVRRGETLGRIARRYGVTLEELRSMNRIQNSRHLQIGQKILIPSGRAKLLSSQRIHSVQYRIKRGDTLSSIAQTHGVSIAVLKQKNNIRNARFLKVGQRITIPPNYNPPSRKRTAVSNSPKKTYRVKRGDTLFSIARKHKVSVVQLKKINRIQNARSLRIGQILKLSPQKQSRMIRHVVKRGENLWKISEQYSVPMNSLLNWNNLVKNSVIKPGQSLKLYVKR